MGRALAIDYGTKKTGLAVSDPLRLSVNGLDTVHTDDLLDFLSSYIKAEEVTTVVIGEPLHADGNPTAIHHMVIGLSRKLQRLYPDVEVLLRDESFSSVRAKDLIRQLGNSRKKRQDKKLVDKMSAVLILKDFLDEQV